MRSAARSVSVLGWRRSEATQLQKGKTAWGTAKALAQAVGQKTALRAMDRALKEGGPFDARLTKLAAEEITPALLAARSEDDESGTNGGRSASRKRGSQGQASAS